uniref:NADH:ubiquinone oxidoreductase intermediate-associated protein 30 domain-containing protein n=1 Tax=Lotharella oceanica TaxID=641309 RepID=A0A7S2TGL5_9EUKA|mmetsp:Transcript_12742/g.24380  ORF Transcript_12742/g.24380 Transcript_12742/m.24380 type:complete len:401 (+) Transcript_12742:565-1767(+)
MRPQTETTKKLFTWGWVPDRADLWTNFDDVIMGGTSASKVESVGGSLKWSGKVIPEGGGFCGLRSDPEKPIDSLQEYDALKLRVRGDGNRYKFTIQLRNGTRYQCPFDTSPGTLQDIELPFSSFVGLSTERANEVDYYAIPLSQADRSDIAFMNIVLSKFEFNGFLNRAGVPGEFSLSIDSITAVAKPAPQIVMVTSAAVERNARIETKEQRQADIPIVQLNPQGILNWKYKGEAALRDSGLTYSVIRPCGLTTLNETTEFALDFVQGDCISGSISRKEIASLVTAALSTPTADGKTFEVRRSEAKDAVSEGAASRSVILQKLQSLIKDTDRYTTGLPILPMAVDPPAEELSKEETQQVLDDPRVKAQRAREPESQQVAGRADDEPAFVVYRDGKALPAA